MKRLGPSQVCFLDCLATHGGVWFAHRRCGWNWGSSWETLRIARSLVRREILAERTIDGVMHFSFKDLRSYKLAKRIVRNGQK